MLMQGHEDVNDVAHLQHDPLYKDTREGDLASQPSISRFENSLDAHSIYALCYGWIDRYVSSLEGRSRITIDIDGTDDSTHGKHQLSMFNGYYGQFMDNELFFHDGDSGQIMEPVPRPGNSYSNNWFVGISKKIIIRIREVYPKMKITIRAHSGFSSAPFNRLADPYDLYYAIGFSSDEVLKRKVRRAEQAVKHLFLGKGEKHQYFISFEYKAGSWHNPQGCYSKIESTGLGMNIRPIVSNLPENGASEIYFGFYVK